MSRKPLDPYLTFLIGYNTAYVGIPFRAAHILSAQRGGSSPERQRLIDAQIAKLRENNNETIWFVTGTNELLGEAGLYQPPKPYDLFDWFQWAINARRAVSVMLDARSPMLRTMRAGEAYGTFAASVVLDELLLITREATLPSLLDVPHHREAAEEIVAATRHLEEVSVGQPEGYVTTVDELSRLAKELPSLDSPQQRAAAVRQLVALVNSQHAKLNETFRVGRDRVESRR